MSKTLELMAKIIVDQLQVEIQDLENSLSYDFARKDWFMVAKHKEHKSALEKSISIIKQTIELVDKSSLVDVDSLLERVMSEVRPYTRPACVNYDVFPAMKEAQEYLDGKRPPRPT